MLPCETPAVDSRIAELKLHDPAGQTDLSLFLKRVGGGNAIQIQLSNHTGLPLAKGEVERFELYAVLVSKVDAAIGGDELGFRFDARTSRLWLASTDFKLASLLFTRRWELQEALGVLFGA